MSSVKNKLRIKFVNNNTQVNTNKSNTYKIALKNNNKFETVKSNTIAIENNTDSNFKINDRVIHNEEQITGKISFISSDKVSIIWDDGTRERFSKNEFNQLSIIPTETNTITETINDNKDEVVETRKIQSTKNTEPSAMSDLDKLYNQAFNEMDDEYDDIIDANPNKLKEQMLKRQVDMMERKIENKQINNIKEQSVDELISLMKDKNMINDSEHEKQQRDLIINMSDSEFEKFKQDIINGNKKNEHQLTEAEKMLQRIKYGGPVIGDFSSQSGQFNNNFSSAETRSLESVASKNISTNEQSNGLNLDGFKNLQGLTKPLQVVSEQKSPRQNIADAISGLDWTTMTKMF